MTKPIAEERSPLHAVFVSMPFGGIEVFTQNLRRRIEGREDLRSTWISLSWKDAERSGVKRFVPWNWTLQGSWIARQRILQAMRERPVDAIFLNHTIPAMALGSLRRSVPVVISMDVTPAILDPFAGHYQVRRLFGGWSPATMRNRMLHRIFSEAACLLPWSELVRSSLLRDHGVPADRVEIVRPGVDRRIWNVSDAVMQERASGPFHVLFVGGDFERKGGDLLLQVAADPRCASWTFHLVSRGAPADVRPNVNVYRDMAPNSGPLLELFRRASVLVLPTRGDISPNVIAEAMAMGLPVVATDVGAIAETVQDGVTGFVVPRDDAGALLDRLSGLASDPELRRRFGEAGRLRASAEFDLDQCAERVVAILRRAAHAKKETI